MSPVPGNWTVVTGLQPLGPFKLPEHYKMKHVQHLHGSFLSLNSFKTCVPAAVVWREMFSNRWESEGFLVWPRSSRPTCSRGCLTAPVSDPGSLRVSVCNPTCSRGCYPSDNPPPHRPTCTHPAPRTHRPTLPLPSSNHSLWGWKEPFVCLLPLFFFFFFTPHEGSKREWERRVS